MRMTTHLKRSSALAMRRQSGPASVSGSVAVWAGGLASRSAAGAGSSGIAGRCRGFISGSESKSYTGHAFTMQGGEPSQASYRRRIHAMWHLDRISIVNGTGLATYAGMTLPRVRPFAWAATVTPTDDSRRLLNVAIALLALVIALPVM